MKYFHFCPMLPKWRISFYYFSVFFYFSLSQNRPPYTLCWVDIWVGEGEIKTVEWIKTSSSIAQLTPHISQRAFDNLTYSLWPSHRYPSIILRLTFIHFTNDLWPPRDSQSHQALHRSSKFPGYRLAKLLVHILYKKIYFSIKWTMDILEKV